MAMAISSLPFTLASTPSPNTTQLKAGHSFAVNCSLNLQAVSKHGSNVGGSERRVWRRRKLTKKDDMLRYKLDRVPFLEEQVRLIKEGGQLVSTDIERLLLSEDNRFKFVNEIAAEANEYVEKNRDEYGGTKKAIYHALSNRVNDTGFYRPDAYAEPDIYKPGPGYLKEFYT